MAEIVSVTSEALEAQVRNLLPSQRGFGEDLQASNVITPIIDLTAAAQGSQIPTLLQTSLSFGSQTDFFENNSSGLIINTAGFYRVYGTVTIDPSSATFTFGRFQMSDGLSTKTIFDFVSVPATTNQSNISTQYDFVVFMRAGETLSAISNDAKCVISGSSRQIADVNGNLVYPVGFTPQ